MVYVVTCHYKYGNYGGIFNTKEDAEKYANEQNAKGYIQRIEIKEKEYRDLLTL